MSAEAMRIEYLADHADCLSTLARWHHEQWSDLNPGDTLDKRIARMRAHLGRRQIPTTFVALSGEILLGSACLVADDMHQQVDLTPWLASVYVASQYRRQGVGTALVGRVVEEAKSVGIETLYLFTPDQETFYARLGWSVIDRTRYEGQTVVIMARRLL